MRSPPRIHSCVGSGHPSTGDEVAVSSVLGDSHGRSMTSTNAARISLHSPAALCCALPHLLGFHPTSSVVIVWLSRGQIILTQRIDLPATHEIPDWSRAVWGHHGVRSADEIVAVMIPPEGGEAHARLDIDGAVDDLVNQAASRRLALRDVIQFTGDRWRSLTCADTRCCPTEGERIDPALRISVAAEFAIEGSAPEPSRETVVRALEPVPSEVDAVVRTGVLGRSHRPRNRELWRDGCISNMLSWWSTAGADDRPGRLAHLLLGLRDLRVRDTLLWEMCHLSAHELRIAQGQLARLLRSSPPGDVAGIATCVGLCAWLNGDGVRAAAAAERAHADDPHGGLGQMLRGALHVGLPPTQWRAMIAGMTRDQCRHGSGEGDDRDGPAGVSTDMGEAAA